MRVTIPRSGTRVSTSRLRSPSVARRRVVPVSGDRPKQAEVYYPSKYKESVQDFAQVHLGSKPAGRQ